MSEKTFKVSNYKAIDEVEITSGAGLIVLGGKNAQGKSSFLDGIREIVKYAGVRETPEPIRQGEDHAVSEIIDHERDRRYVRQFKRAKSGKISSEVGVYALDGAKYENGAQIIAEDLGAEIIDAAAFSMLGARDQRDTLLRQVELPFDLDELARKKKGVEDERKLANADVKRLQGALDSMVKPAKDDPIEEVSAADILERIKAAEATHRHNAEQERLRDQMLAEIDELKRKLELAESAYQAQMDVLDNLQDYEDIDDLHESLAGIEQVNERARQALQYVETEKALQDAEAVAKAKQEALDTLDKQKRDALSAAAFPDPLLSVDDEQVLYDGIPFSQVNSAKQIGIGFDIATLADRELKIGFIKNGDLLDDESLAEIESRAVERGYTVIVERGRSGDEGYVFHEGELV